VKEKVFFLERAGLSQHQRLVGSSIWGSPRIHCFSTKSGLSKKLPKNFFGILGVYLWIKILLKQVQLLNFITKNFIAVLIIWLLG
jgi:hypothetical protein